MGVSLGRRRNLFVSLATVSTTWMVMLLQQHKAIQAITPKEFLQFTQQPVQRGPNRESSRDIVAPKARDGYFNGVPMFFQNGPIIETKVHCVDAGDPSEASSTAWIRRSCQFKQLCFNTESKEYIIFSDTGEYLDRHHVSIGGMNPRYDTMQQTSHRLKWFPRVENTSSLKEGYYELDRDYLLFPFHSFAAHNPGHLLWDDMLPIYSLARLFNMTTLKVLPIRHQLNEPLYATCDKRRANRLQCTANWIKFAPLLGIDPSTFSALRRINVTTTTTESPRSRYVCARHALGGIGMWTDHGFRDHGWTPQADAAPHNIGRGGQLRDFSRFLVGNMLSDGPESTQDQDKIQIVFSLESSKDYDRRLDFSRQVDYLKRRLSARDVSVSTVRMWQLSSQEQVTLAQQTDILVSACGGGSMTATFLPEGASFLVFYNTTGSYDFQAAEEARAKGLPPRELMKASLRHEPARLDWDLLNNAGYLRVHWLPVDTMNDQEDLELLLRLTEHEIAAKRLSR